MWLDSTLGVFLYFGRRAITQGAWMQMKKPAWTSMPVLDVAALKSSQVSLIARSFDQLSGKELRAISMLYDDEVRHEIDDVLEKALGLPSLADLRDLLSREPGLTAVEISARHQDQSEIVGDD